jgi:hypothetical protein
MTVGRVLTFSPVRARGLNFNALLRVKGRFLGEIAEASRSPHRKDAGVSRPARILRSVDFPDPFGPIKPARSPTRRSRETSVNGGRGP